MRTNDLFIPKIAEAQARGWMEDAFPRMLREAQRFLLHRQVWDLLCRGRAYEAGRAK